MEDAVPLGQQIEKAAEIGVKAAEQLKREGKLPSNDAALHFAIDTAKKFLPVLEPIDDERLIAAINASVLAASALTAQIEQAKAQINSK